MSLNSLSKIQSFSPLQLGEGATKRAPSAVKEDLKSVARNSIKLSKSIAGLPIDRISLDRAFIEEQVGVDSNSIREQIQNSIDSEDLCTLLLQLSEAIEKVLISDKDSKQSTKEMIAVDYVLMFIEDAGLEFNIGKNDPKLNEFIAYVFNLVGLKINKSYGHLISESKSFQG